MMLRTLISGGVLLSLACGGGTSDEVPSDDVQATTLSGSIDLRVDPLQDSYPVRGPMPVALQIRNGTDSTVSFRPILDFGGWLDADIVGPDGRALERQMSFDPPNAWPIQLQSGESLSDTIDLRCTILIVEEDECMAMYDMSAPGRYEVRVRFQLPCGEMDCDESSEPVISSAPFLIHVRGNGRTDQSGR